MYRHWDRTQSGRETGTYFRQVLECASPLALFGSRGIFESAGELAHSKTLARRPGPLFSLHSARALSTSNSPDRKEKL